MNILVANTILDRIDRDELAIGLIVRLVRTGEIVAIAKACDYDFIFLDGQHALLSNAQMAEIIEASINAGLAVLIRTRGCDDPNIPLYLDAGATGLIIPDVGTPDQARRAVRLAKFPPLGRRSVPGLMRLFDYRQIAPAQATVVANSRTLLICMIETREGVENASEIAAVEGVDGLHIGCIDLLADMGPGLDLAHPDFIATVKRVIAAAYARDCFVGIGGDRDDNRVAGYIEAGAKFVTAQLDTALLMQSARDRSTLLRKMTKKI